MYTIKLDRKIINEFTNLETALRVYEKNEFFAIKQKLLKTEFDEKTQAKVWRDYRDLLNKAIKGNLEKKDAEQLESYQNVEGEFELFATESEMYFPTQFTRDDDGEIIKVDLKLLDQEITRRWFQHIHDIFTKPLDIRVCGAEDCLNLYVRKRRKDRRFCSSACRLRQWRKNQIRNDLERNETILKSVK